MDDSKARPGFPGDRSQAAADKLRALRERANQALEGHRSRLGEIETQLTGRVRQLAEEFGATLGAASDVKLSHEEEIAALRQQVEEANAKHERFVAQLHAAQEQLKALESQPCADCQQAVERQAAAEAEARRLREELEAATREHEEDRARHEKFVEQLAAARQAITVLQHAAGETSNELRSDLEDLKAAKAIVDEELAAARRDLAALHDECELATGRVAEIEAELAAARTAAAAAATQSQATEQQLADARAELVEARSELAAVTEQVAALTDQVTTLSDQVAASDRDQSGAAAQLEQVAAEAGALQTEVEQLTASLAEATTLCETLQQAAQAAASDMCVTAARAAADREALLEEKASLAELLAAAEKELDQLRESIAIDDQDKLQITLSLQQAESACREYQRQVDKLEQSAAEHAAQAQSTADAPQLRADLTAALAAAAERDATIESLTADLSAAKDELASLHAESVPAATLAEVRRDAEAARAEIVDLQTAVESAQAETLALRAASRTQAEYAELEQKCDLALADLQKLKRENGALRDELAERPAASDQESPELIAVRSERDALAARIVELEAAAEAKPASDEDEQERADLQRRFEMAVDDVRQLKQENAKLKERVAAAEKGGGAHGGASAHGGAGGNDWAAQRARLMAMLEEEEDAGPISSDRTVERATVASTISATDQALAAKDDEIEELRAALAARQSDAGASAAAAQREELLSGDEVIAAERARLAKLTEEFDEKLRKAELELSLERAKLAREQAALRDRLLNLPSPTDNAAAGEAESTDPGKPRRRWSFALGLQDDSTGGKKQK